MRHEIEAFKDYLMNDLKKAQAEGPVQLDEGPLHKVERLKKEEKDRKLREKIEKELKAKADAEEIQRKRREEEEARKRKRWFGFGSKATSAKKVSGGGWFGRKKNNPTSDTSDSEASNGSNGSGTIAKSRWGMLKASTKMGFSMKNNGATSDSEDEGGHGSSPAPSPDGKAHALSEKTGLKAKKNWDKVKAGSKWGFNLFGPSKKQLEEERVKAEEEAREAAFAMAKEAEKAERAGFLANENRYKRNNLLAETDFYALSDVTMSAEQTTYRQALRDITTHANWPHLEESDWPVKP